MTPKRIVPVVAGAVVALAVAARAVLPLSASFPLKAAVCFALVGLVAVARISRANHAFTAFGLPNQVTTGRAVVVALVAAGRILELPLVARLRALREPFVAARGGG